MAPELTEKMMQPQKTEGEDGKETAHPTTNPSLI